MKNYYWIAHDIAIEAHEGQLYGTKPYMDHVYTVVENISKVGEITITSLTSTKDFKTVAFLHDVLEDSDFTSEDLLKRGIPEKLVYSVNLVTKREDTGYSDYLREIAKDEIAWVVKVADTYSNLTESIAGCCFKRVRKYSLQLEKLYKLRKDYL